MIDRKGRIIKVGMNIKHVHHHQVAQVYWKDGELYAGQVTISTYHSSVVEIVD